MSATPPASPAGARPRRVLYVTDIYGGHHGGSEGQLVALAGNLPPGYEARLLVLQQSRWLFPQGFPAPTFLARLGRLTNPLTWVRLLALAGRLRSERIDLVHTYHSDASWQMPLLGALAGVPVVISRRDLGFWHTPRRLALLRRTGRFADLVIANAEAVRVHAVDAEHLHPGQVVVVPNGHAAERFERPADPGLRARLGIPADARLLGLLANLKPLKRQHDLIDALGGELGRRHPDAHVLLIGTGTPAEVAALRERAERAGVGARVHVHGVTGDVVPVLRHLHVGVLCSESEGLSNAILEYLACGLPVVATDVGGNPELVEEEVSGLLYPVGRVDLLSERLGRLLADEPLRARLGAAARARFEGRFRLDRMVDATVACYERVLAPPRPPPSWRLEVLEAPAALEALAPAWRALTGPRRFFAGPTWVLPWLATSGAGRRPVVLTARDADGRLRGVAPFVEVARGVLGFGGPGEGADHLDVVAAPEDALAFARAVLAWFRASPWRRLRLEHLADDAALRAALREAPWRTAHQERCTSVAPWIDAHGTFDDYLGRTLGRKQRHEARRVVKRFREQAGSALTHVEHPDAVEAALDVLLDLHARTFAARGEPTVFQGPRVRALHLAVMRRAAAEGALWLPVIAQDGAPLAAFYGFVWQGVLHHLQSGVDPARRSFGPGRVLRLLTLEQDVFGRGLVDYDFMDGDEPYKREWTDRRRRLYRVVVDKPGPAGRARTRLRAALELAREGARALRARRAARRAAVSPPGP